MGDSSIPCTAATRVRLADLRGERFKNWDAFLNALADVYEGDDSAADFTATVRPTLDEDALADIVAQIQDEIDTLAFDGAVTDSEADRIIERLDALEDRLLPHSEVADE